MTVLLRSDAERNLQAILDAAITTFAEHPDASMSDIAHASGVGRATVYRRFPTREALVIALHDQASAEAGEVIRAIRPEEGTALEVLERLIPAFAEIGDRYRFLALVGTRPLDSKRSGQEPKRAVIAIIERGQAEGSIRSDVPAAWVDVALGSLAIGGMEATISGELAPEDWTAFVTTMLLDGVRARG